MNVRKRNADSCHAFTLVELLVVIAIIGILVALLLPAIQAARESARRAQCQSNIKNVALAVLNYESARTMLPVGMSFDPSFAANISAGLSEFGPNWIIEVLPYFEEQSLYDKFELKLPINNNTSSARNREARGTVISVLLCPSDKNNQVLYMGTAPGADKVQHGDNWARTNYAANAGRAWIHPNFANGPDSAAWKDDCQRGVMGPNASVKLRRITDGTSKTILIGEIRTGLSENDARGVWAMGHAAASLLAKFGSGGDANGPNVCYPNSDDVFSDNCKTAGTKAECMTCHGWPEFAQATVRSLHTGGTFVAMSDGSVQFINDEIETSGSYGNCCTPWDHMIASADGSRGGLYNQVTEAPCK
jgi:prepilin-type N-terminal cleavage/methylation domain-containing protein